MVYEPFTELGRNMLKFLRIAKLVIELTAAAIVLYQVLREENKKRIDTKRRLTHTSNR